MSYCPNCGTEVKEDAKFCPNCGYDLSGEGESTSGEQTFSDKMKQRISKMQEDEAIELILEQAEGMEITRAELKKEAQKKLSGRYGEWFKTIMWFIAGGIVLGGFVLFAFAKWMSSRVTSYSFMGSPYYYSSYHRPFSGVSGVFWFLFFVLILAAALALSCLITAVMQWCAIATLKGQRADGVKILGYFVHSQKNRVLKANVLTTIYTFLWGLLFTIPGIVKSASYAMTNYLLEKEPELSANDAINLSRQIMHGYKLEFLILRYSFYLWTLVGSVTGGIANFYVWPYQYVTEMKFLDELYRHYVKGIEAAEANEAAEETVEG